MRTARPAWAGVHLVFTGRAALAVCGVTVAIACAPQPASAQIRDPCQVITKAEAEGIVGGPLIGPQPSPQGTLCKYYEAGYGESPSRIKLVTIGIWIDGQPDAEAINTRRLAVKNDQSLLPVSSRELAGPGDAAIWVWAGNRLGALYAFKGGTIQVAVKISGTTEQAALAAAKRFAIRALGGAPGTHFAYAPPQMPIAPGDYAAPRILSALYLGTFNQLADDPLTRIYVLSLAQSFNSLCPSVPDPLALLQYGFYHEIKGQKDMFKSAWSSNAEKLFRDVAGMIRRARPHMLEIANEDAETFIRSQQDPTDNPFEPPDPDECMTPQIRHLYDNLALLMQQRRSIPPDVSDDYAFLAQLNPAAQAQFGFNPRAPHVATPALAMKNGCSKYTAAAAAQGEATAMETYCRCVVDAAEVASLPDAEMRALGSDFNDRTLKATADRNSTFAAYWRDCLH